MNRYILFNYYTDKMNGGMCDAVGMYATEEEVYAAASLYGSRNNQYQEVLDMQGQQLAYINCPPPFEWIPLTDVC